MKFIKLLVFGCLILPVGMANASTLPCPSLKDATNLQYQNLSGVIFVDFTLPGSPFNFNSVQINSFTVSKNTALEYARTALNSAYVNPGNSQCENTLDGCACDSFTGHYLGFNSNQVSDITTSTSGSVHIKE